MRPLLVLVAVLLVPCGAHAQWTNRYPRNAGFNHQVYLEGYELPIMASGPLDAALGAKGTVVASRGWLWSLDEASGVATRLTSGAGVDSRPVWSADGTKLAFVRDDSRTLAVMVRDVATGKETEIDRGMAMDPVFTTDGRGVVYTNVTAGDLDLWRADLATGAKTRLTTEAGLELRPQLLPGGERLVYTSKTRAGGDQVRLRALADGKETVLLAGSILSQTRPALSPDGRLLAYAWPGTAGWELRLLSTERPGTTFPLHAAPRARPIAPAWSADGRWIYFSEGDDAERLHLYRIAVGGGEPEEVVVRHWDWKAPTGRLIVRTRCSSCNAAMYPARLSASDGAGHPLIPTSGMARFEGQNGRVFFYTNGTIELEVPAGAAEVRAVRGLATPERVGRAEVPAGGSAEVTLDLQPLWDARAAGYYAGDHHFHLNYGGQMDLAPSDLFPLLSGEALDVATPMLANLHNRFEDQEYFRWSAAAMQPTGSANGDAPLLRFAQEVRPHFLGHIGLLGTSDFFWPWVWGPGYEVYGRDDRPNRVALEEGRRQGGLGYYVHPISGTRDPFTDAGLSTIPVSLVADAAHGAIDLLEVVCLWSNSAGTTELWYRLLNAGFPVAPSGGTDVMTDFHRTMALGTTRVYVRPEGGFNWGSYMRALAAGRSFVTTGPMLDLEFDGGARPGDVVMPKGGSVRFSLRAASAVPVDSVAIVVNGKTVRMLGALAAGEGRTFEGSVQVPRGGWIAARAIGPRVTQWPAMAEYSFAHTAPVWIGNRGSTEPAAQRAAAADLLRALDNAEKRLVAGYGDAPIPKLRAHFAGARTILQGKAAPPAGR